MAYNNTYSGLGLPLTNITQAFKDKAKQIAQAINVENNPNPATATTTAEKVIEPITGGRVVLAVRNANQAAQQAATLPPATLPPTQDTKSAKTWKDYLLWIALGGVVAFGAYKMLTGKKKRR